MERDDIVEPQRQVGRSSARIFWDFARQGFPRFEIYLHANLIGERVLRRVVVVSAMGSVVREAPRGTLRPG